MYERILVAVDGSENSRNAGMEAVKIAKKMDATVIVAHVINQMDSMNIDESEDNGKRYINEIRDFANENDVKSEDLLIYGLAVYDIKRMARKSNADIMVMSALGDNKSRSKTIGKLTEFVIENIDLPVILF